MPAARPKSRTKSPLPVGVLTGSMPDTLRQDNPESRISRLLRGDFRAEASAAELAGIPPMVLYQALQRGLAPAESIIDAVASDKGASLLDLASFLPQADTKLHDRLLARIFARMADASVKDRDTDLALALPVLWPQLGSSDQKQAALGALVKYLKRKARSTLRDEGRALLTGLATLEPDWYAGVIELALTIPSRPDLLTMLRDGDGPLVYHLLSRPELSAAIDPVDAWLVAALRFPRDAESALRILDAVPGAAGSLLTNGHGDFERPFLTARPEESGPLLIAWLDSRDPDTVCEFLPAWRVAGKHPGMGDGLRKAVLSRVCATAEDAFVALAEDAFFNSLSAEQMQMLIDASQAMRKSLLTACLGEPSQGASIPPWRSRRLQILATREWLLPHDHPGRRILAIDLIACLLLLESVSPAAFPEVDRALAHSVNAPGESFLDALLETWSGSSANEVKTVWRAMAPQDADTATGLIDGMLSKIPKIRLAQDSASVRM